VTDGVPSPADGTAPGRLGRLYRSSAVRFLAVGVCSFIIDFSLLFLLHEVLHVAVWVATAVAFVVTFFFNYTLQRAFAFTSTSNHGAALVKYIALVAFNTVAITLIVSVFDSLIGGWELGKIVATVLSTVWNYFIYRHWIFVKIPDALLSDASHPERIVDRTDSSTTSEGRDV
jgi:putative flippase GtrA